MTRFRFEKLVRDNIKHYVEHPAMDLKYHKLEGAALLTHLLEKLAEETQEVVEAKSQAEREEELGDVLDIVDALIRSQGLSREKIAASRDEKLRTRGGFEQGYYMEWLEVRDSEDPVYAYLSAQQARYPVLEES